MRRFRNSVKLASGQGGRRLNVSDGKRMANATLGKDRTETVDQANFPTAAISFFHMVFLAAIRLPIRRKRVLKQPYLGTASDGNALFS
jgi:hypothetical protein